MKVYILNRSLSSIKVIFLLLKSQQEFDIEVYYKNPWAALTLIGQETGNIFNYAPVIVDGANLTRTGASSAWYLCEHYMPELLDNVKIEDYLEWTIFLERAQDIMRRLYQLSPAYQSSDKVFTWGSKVLPEEERIIFQRFEIIDRLLATQSYTHSNKLSLIDILVYSGLFFLQDTGYDYSMLQNLTAWYQRISNKLAKEVDIINNELTWVTRTVPRLQQLDNGVEKFTFKWIPK
jgi:hypothetical protein